MSQRPLLAAALTAVLVVAGCGSDDARTTTAATNAASDGQGEAVEFAACMRTHGVPDFPDPNAQGDYDYGVSVSPAVWQKALHACKDLMPPGTFDTTRDAEEQSAALKLARCVRENGVEDFPDPVDGEPLVNTYKIPSSNQPGGMDILNAALDRCSAELADAINGGEG